ncbi:MAG: hypothetical protein RL272_110 [Candidatus Parcubacteria bacterium]|jgi:NAD(P)-dependent dehydrogenase (short-subunit alcohol dehydrogenase family)
MDRSLILGGTKGLGRALAIASLARGITPVVAGRSAYEARKDPGLAGSVFLSHDLSDLDDALKPDFPGYLKDVRYVFWVAGAFLRKPLTDCTPDEVRKLADIHFLGPVGTIAIIHRLMKMARPLAGSPGQPYHLVTIASTSSWRVRDDETVYCALKAAKAHFTRNFARELARDLPGSKTALVNPGGMKTPGFWAGSGQDIGAYMEPDDVARIIWDRSAAQAGPYDEYSLMRNADGSPRVEDGPRTPEQPF